MKVPLSVWLAVLAALPVGAADRPVWRSAELDDVKFNTRLVRDLHEIQRLLGSDLDQEFILVELNVRPLYNSNVLLDREDFLLRSYRNNERSFAQSPDRIAGDAVLVLSQGRAKSSGGVFSQETVFGAPGLGRPGGLGGSVGSQSEIKVTQGDSGGETTLLAKLGQIELPMGETRVPVRGYLFFQVNPKHKLKHLVLNYDGPAGKCKIPFK